MCGIVGCVGSRDAVPIVLDGLARLEYRGYDSAGMAVIDQGVLSVHKVKGKITELRDTVPAGFSGGIGIGHTRWATHGVPNQVNAHPHTDPSGRVAVVHNGIIDNAASIKARLISEGAVFASETDSEVLAHLIARSNADTLVEAVRQSLGAIEGTYGIAVIDLEHPEQLVAARNGSPVVIGVAENEHFVASDVGALIRYTQQIAYLDDGEIAVIERNQFKILSIEGTERTKGVETVDFAADSYDKGQHEHFLRKEIFEQPESVQRTLSGRLDPRFATAHLGGIDLSAQEILRTRRVQILGCGSAYYAGLAGAQLIERIARIPSGAEPASEFRYSNPIIEADTVYVAVSQSGETLDTLRAVQEVRRKGGTVLGVINVVGSSIARECGSGIYLHAGPEISVTSTKSFTSTVTAFALLALHLGRIRDLGQGDGGRLINALEQLPTAIAKALETEAEVRKVAERYRDMQDTFFVGRVRGYPVACEAAQKLKEISYIHAEAYPASELKHGPLALITPEVPTFVVIPDDELFDKNVATLARSSRAAARSSPSATPRPSTTWPTTSSWCPSWSPSWIPSSSTFRCSSWPTRLRCCATWTSTSPGIWPRASPSNNRCTQPAQPPAR
jgi:glucosamine--fructose-6-phosphate aminotransferase (isomerizing)